MHGPTTLATHTLLRPIPTAISHNLRRTTRIPTTTTMELDADAAERCEEGEEEVEDADEPKTAEEVETGGTTLEEETPITTTTNLQAKRHFRESRSQAQRDPTPHVD